MLVSNPHSEKLYRITYGLALFTIYYNIVEGFVATGFGYDDESLTLFGFGVDSFIESISGIGILQMINRISINPRSPKGPFEKRALKITGYCFFLLVFGLVGSSFYSFYTIHKPETSFFGVLISLISIVVMIVLLFWKTKMGKALNSKAILADASCTKVCIYMSVVLLLSSAIYELFKIPYIDGIGALFIAYFAFKEGRECFEHGK